ncbi:methyl-accepting chemotaxis protein [Oceanidesulfovibrio marinus]|uniref:HAMP domain-containing protein n=1 Tax=Oceanidesulfovibrio marinus TaxID=370038 RepID=A0ABX6NBB4_9BACT|nr:methyl-accepting chemotaxis protein [Oceanidesulfovibrio marinus]QJT07526.1 HAMP domain-containing protein [Oceanidesulfovibrio marinus]
MTLKSKFLIPAVLLICIGMSITAWVSYQRSTHSLKIVAAEKSVIAVHSLNTSIGLWTTGIKNELVTLSKTEDVINAITLGPYDPRVYDAALDLLSDSVARHSTFDSILVVDANGSVLTSTNKKMVGVDLAKRGYFKSVMSGKTAVSPPVFSKELNEHVFVVATPIHRNGDVIGMLSAGVRIKTFSEKFVAPIATSTSYPFILAPDGVVIAHPDDNVVGKLNVYTETSYGPEIAKSQNGTLDDVSLGAQKLITFEKEPTTGWVTGMAVIKEAAFADARETGLLILGMSAAMALLLAVGIWVILSLNVLRPIGALVHSATRISEGNLTTSVKSSRKDEIGILQRAMGAMLDNLKGKIDEAEAKEQIAAEQTTKANAAMADAEEARRSAENARMEGMLYAAAQLKSVVAAITDAVDAISRQIEQSTQGATSQSERMGETATAMEEMTATVLEVARSAATAADTSDSARKNAQEGSDIVATVIASIGETQSMALNLKHDMTQLGEQVQGIGQIMDVISDIADQTNLLALNAAIEAARAGEAGRGFAVVADEVRKLAEKTMSATKEVGDAITGIQQGTIKNVNNVDQSVRHIDEATEMAGRSGQSLATIVELVNQASDQVRSIATASEQQSSATDEINHNVMDVSRIAEEVATALSQTEESLSGLEEQTRVLNQLIEKMQNQS